MSQIPDWDELIEGIISRDERRMSQFIDLTQQKLFEFCFYLTGHRQLAEDLSQEAYLKAFVSVKKLKDRTKVIAWLKQIARNMHIDHLRSASRSKPHLSFEKEGGELEAPQGVPEEAMAVIAVLQKLEEGDRELLVLIDIQGYSYQEASDILDVPEGTIKSRVHRARQKFSDLF